MTFRMILLVACFYSCHQNIATETEPVVVRTAFEETLSGIDTFRMDTSGQTVYHRIPAPRGFRKVDSAAGSFAYFLQHFPLKPADSKVLLFNGSEKNRQDVHAAVLDIDVGKRDLQQCADAVMRLWAEYLWSGERYDDIHFNFTNGFRADYARWRAGERIRVQGSEVSWVKSAAASPSYETFRRYLTMVFSYAGTLSLARELQEQDLDKIQIGDVFIRGGSPGHAIIVMDKAVKVSTGAIVVLLAQSYMPAQDIHILQNWSNKDSSPWYPVEEFAGGVNTPEWQFSAQELKKF